MTVIEYYGITKRLGVLTMLYLNELFEKDEKYEECAKIIAAVKIFTDENGIKIGTRSSNVLAVLGVDDNDKDTTRCMAEAKTVKFRIQMTGVI